MRRALTLLVLCTIAVAPAAAASPQDVANDVAENMMSPFCPGVTLHDCPSGEADRLRARIAGWAEDGLTRAQIFDRLESEYGPDIRATPAGSGVGLVAWLLPALAAAAGIGVGWVLLRRWTESRVPPDDADEVSEEERARVQDELAAFRGEARPGRFREGRA